MPRVKNIIEGYIKLRDLRDNIKQRHREELAPIADNMQKMENWLLGELTKMDTDSVTKKGVGTAYKSTRTSVKIVDWEEAYKFVQENNLEHMLERRLSKAAVAEFVEANGEAPPGVDITREIVVNIRRS